jgi:CRISPR system Cascade subunit CasD
MKYLLFQLYGALQAWGSVCPGCTRQTDDHPTKSGVIGLVGACLGLSFEETGHLDELFSSTGFACRTDIPGTLLEDYHTVSTEMREEPVKFPTIESYRYYLEGALFTICLWKTGDSEYSLEKIAEALKKPTFTPYLGRSYCPQGLPFQPVIVTGDDLKQAFGQYVADSLNLLVKPKTKEPKVYWEGNDASMTPIYTNHRYDVPKNRASRSFVQRVEHEGRLQCT